MKSRIRPSTSTLDNKPKSFKLPSFKKIYGSPQKMKKPYKPKGIKKKLEMDALEKIGKRKINSNRRPKTYNPLVSKEMYSQKKYSQSLKSMKRKNSDQTVIDFKDNKVKKINTFDNSRKKRKRTKHHTTNHHHIVDTWDWEAKQKVISLQKRAFGEERKFESPRQEQPHVKEHKDYNGSVDRLSIHIPDVNFTPSKKRKKRFRKYKRRKNDAKKEPDEQFEDFLKENRSLIKGKKKKLGVFSLSRYYSVLKVYGNTTQHNEKSKHKKEEKNYWKNVSSRHRSKTTKGRSPARKNKGKIKRKRSKSQKLDTTRTFSTLYTDETGDPLDIIDDAEEGYFENDLNDVPKSIKKLMEFKFGDQNDSYEQYSKTGALHQGIEEEDVRNYKSFIISTMKRYGNKRILKKIINQIPNKRARQFYKNECKDWKPSEEIERRKEQENERESIVTEQTETNDSMITINSSMASELDTNSSLTVERTPKKLFSSSDFFVYGKMKPTQKISK